MNTAQTDCPQCAAPVSAGDRFCESCGLVLSGLERVAIPGTDPPTGPCPDCGNDEHTDGYCTVCGRRRDQADRFEAVLAGVVLITDRGLAHHRNEDAAAAAVLAGDPPNRPPAIVAAVCDGVSSTGGAAAAAAAACDAGVAAMVSALAASATVRTAVLRGLADAARGAGGVAPAPEDPSTAPSCTYSAVAVAYAPDGTVQVAVGNVGDSRVYWFPAPPAAARQLTVDDSVAQELISAGLPADSGAVLAGAHTLTHWLGADAGAHPWSDSGVRTLTPDGPGLLLLCTDGLWNYLPAAADIAPLCHRADATASARALTEHALAAGGHDNITAVLIPVEGPI